MQQEFSYLEHHWGIASKQVNYNNKSILDLGADNGSTAEIFLKWGAKRVIAVEGDTKLASELLSKYSQSDKVVAIYAFINDSSQIEEFIRFYKPDIIKVDIEGAEIHLLSLNPKIISSVNEWIIEVHSEELEIKVTNLFKTNSYSKYLIPMWSQGHDWISYYKKEPKRL